MSEPEAKDRAKRYRQLCKEAAQRLNVGADSPKATHYATLSLLQEQLQVRLIEGHNVDASALLRIADALQSMLPQEKLKFEVQTMLSVVGTYRCTHCGKFNHIPDGEFTPAPERYDNAKYPPTIDAKPVKETPAQSASFDAPEKAQSKQQSGNVTKPALPYHPAQDLSKTESCIKTGHILRDQNVGVFKPNGGLHEPSYNHSRWLSTGAIDMANAEAAAATYLKVKVDAGDCTQNCVEAKNWLAGWRGCHVRF